MAGMSIGEVARKVGLRPSAIRYYEKLGLLPAASRVNGRRRYDHRVLDQLAIVRFARHLGFNIAEVKLLLKDVHERPPPERWRALARQKAAQLGEIIAQAGRAHSLLHETLGHQCPKLVERGRALLSRLVR